MPKEDIWLSPPVGCRLACSTSGVVGKVTAALGMGDRYRWCTPRWQWGTWGSGGGGGWEIKNARCRKIESARCRKHGGLVNGGVRRRYEWGVHGSRVYELWPRTGPSNRVYVFPPLSKTWPWFAQRYLLCLPNRKPVAPTHHSTWHIGRKTTKIPHDGYREIDLLTHGCISG